MIMILAVSGCVKTDETTDNIEVKKKVQIQEIVQDKEVNSKLLLSATVVPKEYSLIRSLTPGTLEFLAPIGSQVYAGQPLFSIRDAGVENNYFNTLQNFQQTQITSNQRVQQAELALNSAKARLDLARTQYDTNISQTQQAIITAEDAVTLSYNSAYNSIYQILINYNSRNLDNPSYTLKDVLSSNQSLKSDTTFLFIIAVNDFQNLSNTANKDNLPQSLADIYKSLLSTKKFVDSTAILLQSAIVNENYLATAIAIDKSTNSNYQSIINTHLSSIIAGISNLENTSINNKISNNNAQAQLDLAEIEYNNLEIALQNAKDGAILEQSMSQSQLDSAAYNYNNLTLASPFSGTILSHFVGVGEQVGIGQELVEIGNLSIVEITVDVDVDFAKAIKLGDQVMIDGQYKGVVTAIDPIGDLKSGKVSVTVQSQEAGAGLVAGSTAEVEFSLLYTDVNTIVVPIKSVTIESSGNYVFVVNNENKVVRKNVNLGQIYGDKVSVLSGLEEGDKLILLNGVFVSVDDEVEIVN
jgi:RND family efflux transporter MFP subunit